LKREEGDKNVVTRFGGEDHYASDMVMLFTVHFVIVRVFLFVFLFFKYIFIYLFQECKNCEKYKRTVLSLKHTNMEVRRYFERH